MLSKVIIIFSWVLFAHTINTHCFTISVESDSGSKNITASESTNDAEILMALVGTINGKTYFRDASQARDWNSAKSYCTSLQMKQAYFTSTAETAFIKANAPAGRYWTSGIDVPELSDFHWVGSTENIPNHPFKVSTTTSLNSLALVTRDNPSTFFQDTRNYSGDYHALCVLSTA